MVERDPIENAVGEQVSIAPVHSAAALRALAEAEARRSCQVSEATPVEFGGRSGPDPVRFGDWEINGLARDF